MSVRSEIIEIKVGSQSISGSIVTPCEKFPGILFVHGWGGSQQRDLARAKNITGLGCVCLTFDLRGHERTEGLRGTVSRDQSLADLLAAYDRLVSHPSVDPEAIAVIGTSYGGYLATILSAMRPIKWMALRVPALYWDADWDMPKQELDRDRLAHYRRSAVTAADNRALAACKEFRGDVLLIESERDDYVPHATLMSYRTAFELAHSLTYRLVDGADHALSSDISQSVYSSMLTNWISEMVIGARLVDYPHHSAKYS
ncbi:alpha/beta hydrolase family protein [Pseudomonas alliivorans]|uniref:alpha/beta hydrolase family protein n=1 Tax=Pseudomonas alliivorans TaxID=2810613 RepID=UPI0020909668|nr:alpha/beta fold hydrolase [Pseudomonas alliivorans]MCO5367376.1 alpha/beta fold hydrolase [Pseudomonas alliivorans]MEE4305718.1 alpha/beta fold hydrolase [Pseudomonas alliivorans]MEE4574139.1 alpha/beta fold hydrolase [Pseudomonas alliivorans]MEE5083675.1 alpha/beta fold hydrolase [Pseudomonas alliivorans]MEE5098747.1 alpha/beta fold hydrolase [Pseudomonas alliivorans]